MNDTTPPAPRVPLAKLRQAGADHITVELHRALPEQEQKVIGGFNSAI